MITLKYLSHADRANHKYIAKVGDRYFYTPEELSKFKKTVGTVSNTNSKISAVYKPKKVHLTSSVSSASVKMPKKKINKELLKKITSKKLKWEKEHGFKAQVNRLIEEKARRQKYKEILSKYNL